MIRISGIKPPLSVGSHARVRGSPRPPPQSVWQRRKRALLPLLLFAITYAGLLAVLLHGSDSVVTRELNSWTARTTALALWALGAHGLATGTLVTSSIYSLKIINECTAVFPIIIFLAAVVAYPARWLQKLLGVALGIPALLLLNLFRLVSLFYIGYWCPAAFETAHLIVWQTVMIILTVFMWLLWAMLVSGSTRV